MLRDEEDLLRTRATLLGRIGKWDDQQSWQEFFDIYWKLIYGVARKAGLTEVEAQDVVQETLFAVAKHIPKFKYDPALGSFRGWLLNMTRWRIVDQVRKRGPQIVHRPVSGDASQTATVEKIPDANSLNLDAAWDPDYEKTLLAAAMKNVKPKLGPKQFQIFDFYVNKEWSPEKVAETFHISVNQVYLAKSRITEMLKEEVRRLEKEVT